MNMLEKYRGIVENKNSLKFASGIILGLSCYLQVCFLCSGVSLWRLCTSKSCFPGKIYCILQAHSSFSGVVRIHAIAEHERRGELAETGRFAYKSIRLQLNLF